MARDTPLKFVGTIRERHKARKAKRREKLRGLLGGGGGTADSLPGGIIGGGLGGFIAGHKGSGGVFGGGLMMGPLKPRAEEAGVPEHSHDVQDTDESESPMVKKLKFGRKKKK